MSHDRIREREVDGALDVARLPRDNEDLRVLLRIILARLPNTPAGAYVGQFEGLGLNEEQMQRLIGAIESGPYANGDSDA